MTYTDISVFSSFLAMSLSVISLLAVCLIQRRMSAQGRRSAQQSRASERATIEQLHTAVAHMRHQVEQTRELSRAHALVEVDRRIDAVVAAELRLREASDAYTLTCRSQSDAWSRWQQPSHDFASTEPMGLTADMRPIDSMCRAAQGPVRATIRHPAHA